MMVPKDPNHNGRVDNGESDPVDIESTSVYQDEDNDGLTDAEELILGTLNDDGDLDDDGLPDGLEDNWRSDTDRDGLPNYLDPDSDNDGLPDGLEKGLAAPMILSDTVTRKFYSDQIPTSHQGLRCWWQIPMVMRS